MSRSLVAAGALGLILCGLAGAARAEERLELRVICFDAEGRSLSSRRAERLAALAPALVALRPQVVILQGVWREDDGAHLTQALAQVGLGHSVHLSQGLRGSGLLVAAAWPLEQVELRPFALAGRPHAPWEGDWYARRGVALLRLVTPLGQVVLADAQLLEGGGGPQDRVLQLCQALELAEAVGAFGAEPPPSTWDEARPPLLVGVDWAAGPDTLPARAAAAGADLTPLTDEQGAPQLLGRPGGALGWRVRSAGPILGTEVPLGASGAGRLASQPGLRVDLELVRLPRRAPAARDPRPAWRAAAGEALSALRAELGASEQRERVARGAGWLELALGLLGLALVRKVKRGRLPLAVVALVLIHLATRNIYLGRVWEPALHQRLTAAAARLEE